MTGGAFFYLSLIGLLVTIACGIGTKLLRDFSLRELEDFCRRRRQSQHFSSILDHHERLALTAESLLVIGTSLFLVAGSLWMLGISDRTKPFQSYEILAPLALGGLLLLAATVWIPTAVVRLWSIPLLFYTWRFWWGAGIILWPLTIGVSIVDTILRRLAGRPEEKEDEEEAFEDEIRTMVTTGEHEGLLEADARDMIEGVIELGDADVADIMTPRSEIDAIEANTPWSEIFQFVIQVGRTRIPVYDKVLDNVLGILFVKDLLLELSKPESEPRRPLRDLLRQPWYVPKTKAGDDMLQEFLHTRSHLAIVLDEYRSVAGVVTIEDVLEEIVGEIEDESDQSMGNEIVQLDEFTAEALGKVHLDQINEQLSLELPEPDEIDTIGGFVVESLGHIPQVGETLTAGNVRITVLEASRRRVERVRIERLKENQRETA